MATMQVIELQGIIKVFTDKYYAAMDQQRHDLATLYAESGVCVWNGRTLHGKNQIMKFINNLPKSRHDCNMLDAQQINAISNDEPERQYLVVVGGNATFNNGEDKEFQQTFFINEMNNHLLILNDTYRLY